MSVCGLTNDIVGLWIQLYCINEKKVDRNDNHVSVPHRKQSPDVELRHDSASTLSKRRDSNTVEETEKQRGKVSLIVLVMEYRGCERTSRD